MTQHSRGANDPYDVEPHGSPHIDDLNRDPHIKPLQQYLRETGTVYWIAFTVPAILAAVILVSIASHWLLPAL